MNEATDKQEMKLAETALPPVDHTAMQRVYWRKLPDDPKAKDGYVGMFSFGDATTLVTQLGELHVGRRIYRMEPVKKGA